VNGQPGETAAGATTQAGETAAAGETRQAGATTQAGATAAGATTQAGERQRLAAYLAVIGDAVIGDAVIGHAGEGHGDGPAQLRSGQFHDVVLVGDVAYRFPRDDQTRRALAARVAVLRVINDSDFPVPVPEPLTTVLAGDQEPGRCYVALSRLRGQPLPTPLDPRAEPAVLGELSRVLAALGALGADPAVAAVVPGADPDQWKRFGRDVRRVLFGLMSGPGRQRAEAELARVAAVNPAGIALVHGDLGGANLLWDAAPSGPRLTGILDWDEAHLGSPAEDVASLAATFGWSLAERLMDVPPGGAWSGAAGSAGAVLADARAIAATFALQQALPAALSQDSAMLADGLTRYV
jgi:aminoglycoside phosphotransferase (APT) family kinase protein